MSLLELLTYMNQGKEKYATQDSRGNVVHRSYFNTILFRASRLFPDNRSIIPAHMLLTNLRSKL